MPIIVIPRLLLSILSWALLAAAAYLLWSWYDGYDLLTPDGAIHHVAGDRWRLYAGSGLLAWSFLGRFIVLLAIPAGADEPREARGEATTVVAPDGSVLH